MDAAALGRELAVLSGHLGAPRDGILEIRARATARASTTWASTAGAEAMDGVKALLCFGENPEAKYLEGLEFLAVCDTHLTPAAQRADVVFPGSAPACANGTYTNTERRLQQVNPAVDPAAELLNWEVAAAIANVYDILRRPTPTRRASPPPWTRPCPPTGTGCWARSPAGCSPAPPRSLPPPFPPRLWPSPCPAWTTWWP